MSIPLGARVQPGDVIGTIDPNRPHVEGDNWQLATRYERCSHKGCRKPAVMVMVRLRYKPAGTLNPQSVRWGCCDDLRHSYGRRLVDGVIWWDPDGRVGR